jgi:hypothetical protein
MCGDKQNETEDCPVKPECVELFPKAELDLIRERLKIDFYRKIEEREVRGVTNL